MPRKPRTQADRIRALLDRGKTYAEVERRLGVTNAAVWQADHHRRPVGRPPEGLPKERLTLYVQAVTAARLRDRAEGRSLGEAVDELAERPRSSEPPSAYVPCKECGAEVRRFELAELPAELERLAHEITTHYVTDREPRHHASRVSSEARVRVSAMLDRMHGYCLDCAPWMHAMCHIETRHR